jgi:hypothetical protein
MLARAAFILIALFWLTMSVLLWRAEFGSRAGAGSVVPAGLVWQKVLTAPDSSSLVIARHGKRIGMCHWITGVAEQWSEISDENLPTGIPAKVRGYRLRLEGSALLTGITNQVRFELALRLDQRRAWEELRARVSVRPFSCEAHSLAAEKTVRLKADTGNGRFEWSLKFADLQNPSLLARELFGPFAGGVLDGLELPVLPSDARMAPELSWEARETELRIGHAPVKVYRLQTRWLDRWSVTLFVSRVGEILRVELPDGLELANDQLTVL